MKWPSVAVLALGLVMLAASESSAGGFNIGNVHGGYGFSFDGVFIDGTRVAAVGWFNADGHGNITNGVRTLSIGFPTGAMVIQQTFTCMYSVEPVGTGTATCQFIPGHSETLAFVIAPGDGSQVQLIGTDAIAVVRGGATRQ